MSADPHAVWIVEDSELYRTSIAAVVEGDEGLRCPVAVESAEEALAELERRPAPEIVLMDLSLPGMSGTEATRAVLEGAPDARIVILTVHEEDDKVFEAIRAGASGYLLKPSDPERILRAVHDALAGAAPINPFIARKILDVVGPASGSKASERYGLTARERDVLSELLEGKSTAKVARALGISYHTVDTHIRKIYAKLHVHSRSQAVLKAVRERLV